MARVIVEVNSLQNKDLIGRLVISNAGRDKGSCYVVLESLSDNLLLLVKWIKQNYIIAKKEKVKTFNIN